LYFFDLYNRNFVLVSCQSPTLSKVALKLIGLELS
jgi:hypothetical protein